MLPLNKAQRVLLADTLREIGNLGAAAMVFGQFISGNPFSMIVAVVGTGIWVVFIGCAVRIARRIEV
jgi:hypothetical protein